VGKRDIEDALLRLDNASLEEMRMATAELLKGIHVIQGMIQGIGDKLQVFDDIMKVKDISQKDINSE